MASPGRTSRRWPSWPCSVAAAFLGYNESAIPSADPPSSPRHPLIEGLDAYQRRHHWLGLPIAVVYKFVDDQGAYLTALIAFYGFLSVFPLLLLMVTILGFLLEGDPGLRADVVESTFAEFPVVGTQLRQNVESLRGSGVGLAVGVAGTIYGCLGVAGATQNAFNRAWAVPRFRRPNPIRLRLRSLLLLLVLGVGAMVTTALSALASAGGTFGPWLGIATIALTTLANLGLFMIALRVLSPRDVPWRDLRSGALVAAVGWQVVQVLGSLFVAQVLRGASEAYGVFGLVLGLVAWIYLLAVILVLAAEVNVVAHRRLWPRSLLTPFTDRVALTPADERAYTSYATSEQYKGFEVVEVDFEADQGDPHRSSGGDGEA